MAQHVQTPPSVSPVTAQHPDRAPTRAADDVLRHAYAASGNHPPGRGTGAREHDNIPDRFEQFVRGENDPMVTDDVDTRVPNCMIFHFHKEDHTLGNLLKYQLHKNPHVTFSGYKQPHPNEPEFDLRIQTDGSLTPKKALFTASVEIIRDLSILEGEFTKEWELHKVRTMGQEGMGGAGQGGQGGAGGAGASGQY